jgi:hypothetical protein
MKGEIKKKDGWLFVLAIMAGLAMLSSQTIPFVNLFSRTMPGLIVVFAIYFCIMTIISYHLGIGIIRESKSRMIITISIVVALDILFFIILKPY